MHVIRNWKANRKVWRRLGIDKRNLEFDGYVVGLSFGRYSSSW